MNSSPIVPDDAKDQFWAVVRTCLREFHHQTAEEARRKVAQFRKKLEDLTPEQNDFFYHAEPFDVACELAHQPLNLEEYRERYLNIRDEQHGNGVLNQILRRPAK